MSDTATLERPAFVPAADFAPVSEFRTYAKSGVSLTKNGLFSCSSSLVTAGNRYAVTYSQSTRTLRIAPAKQGYLATKVCQLNAGVVAKALGLHGRKLHWDHPPVIDGCIYLALDDATEA